MQYPTSSIVYAITTTASTTSTTTTTNTIIPTTGIAIAAPPATTTSTGYHHPTLVLQARELPAKDTELFQLLQMLTISAMAEPLSAAGALLQPDIWCATINTLLHRVLPLLAELIVEVRHGLIITSQRYPTMPFPPWPSHRDLHTVSFTPWLPHCGLHTVTFTPWPSFFSFLQPTSTASPYLLLMASIPCCPGRIVWRATQGSNQGQ